MADFGGLGSLRNRSEGNHRRVEEVPATSPALVPRRGIDGQDASGPRWRGGAGTVFFTPPEGDPLRGGREGGGVPGEGAPPAGGHQGGNLRGEGKPEGNCHRVGRETAQGHRHLRPGGDRETPGAKGFPGTLGKSPKKLAKE